MMQVVHASGAHAGSYGWWWWWLTEWYFVLFGLVGILCIVGAVVIFMGIFAASFLVSVHGLGIYDFITRKMSPLPPPPRQQSATSSS